MHPLRFGGAPLVMVVALTGCTTSARTDPSEARSPNTPFSVEPREALAVQPAHGKQAVTHTASPLERAEPVPLESRPLDTGAVEQLVEDARANDSAELVLIKDDELVGDWRFTKASRPIPVMSITKCILSLAIGSLIDRG